MNSSEGRKLMVSFIGLLDYTLLDRYVILRSLSLNAEGLYNALGYRWHHNKDSYFGAFLIINVLLGIWLKNEPLGRLQLEII